jgi:hypothetical protein
MGTLSVISKKQEPQTRFQTRPLLLSDDTKTPEHECTVFDGDEGVTLQLNGGYAIGTSSLGIVSRESECYSDENGG